MEFYMIGFLIFVSFLFIIVISGISLFVFIKYSNQIKKWWAHSKSNPLIRFSLLFVLLILLMIPLLIVDGLVKERSYRYHSVLKEIGKEWGDPQRIMGPFLVVPYEYKVQHQEKKTNKNGEVEVTNRTETIQTHAVFLPHELKLDSQLTPDYRYRSIYQSLVYHAKLSIKGNYSPLNFKRLQHSPTKIHWDKSYLSMGLSDTRAIKRKIDLQWNEKIYAFDSGPQLSLLKSGIHAPLELSLDQSKQTVSFALNLNFNGSLRFEWAPVGQDNQVQIQSSWASPSFRGNFLPESREISEQGFVATWRVPSLARSYPQSWEQGTLKQKHELLSFHGGVHLFEPVNIYTKISRCIKYGFLFLGLTLLALVLVERSSKKLLHFFHYGLTAITMIVFYLLILSVAEHWGFDLAYLIASSIVTVTVGCYHISAFKNFKIALLNSMILGSLYVILFIILQLQDFALLVGSLVLLLVVWIVMYQTRHLEADPAKINDDALVLSDDQV
jgi:inner membrane protein